MVAQRSVPCPRVIMDLLQIITGVLTSPMARTPVAAQARIASTVTGQCIV